jgi:hypothetical protein
MDLCNLHLLIVLFSFMKGNYKDFDMTNLNLTIVRDYSLYMALKSAGQGIGEKVRIHAFGFPLSDRLHGSKVSWSGPR